MSLTVRRAAFTAFENDLEGLPRILESAFSLPGPTLMKSYSPRLVVNCSANVERSPRPEMILDKCRVLERSFRFANIRTRIVMF